MSLRFVPAIVVLIRVTPLMEGMGVGVVRVNMGVIEGETHGEWSR